MGRFLPTTSILEIAPGFGRWTRFLLGACERYVGVDLSEACIQRCSSRFKGAAHARFVKNDGQSLKDVQDGTADVVFSFDSLVHVDIDVLNGYVEQIIGKLSARGVAFIHHSNALSADSSEAAGHARALDTSALIVRDLIRAAGGMVLVQEEINWGGTTMIDALSLFSRVGAFPEREPVLIKNPDFMREALLIKAHVSPYCAIEARGPDQTVPEGAGPRPAGLLDVAPRTRWAALQRPLAAVATLLKPRK